MFPAYWQRLMNTTKTFRTEITLLVALAASAGFFGYLGYGLLELPGPPVSFSADQAMIYVEEQMAYGPRITGTPAHREMGVWVVKELKENGWDVLIQPFRPLEEVEGRNIIAYKGSGPVIILGAHYDTRMIADHDPDPGNREKPVPGANDGASGVAVLLEMARTLDVASTNHTICLAFFDAEDNGYIPGWDWILGSRYFVENLDELGQCQSPRYTVIVDMIGDADQQLLWEPNSDRGLTEAIWSIAAQLGYGEWFRLAPGTHLTDDHTPFIEAGFTAIDIIDFTYPYWHTIEDTIDKLGVESFQRVGATLEMWLESGAPGP